MTSDAAEIFRRTLSSSFDGVLHLPRLEISQRGMSAVTRYEIREAPRKGQAGRFLAIAQQKHLAMRSEVTFFAEEERRTPLFSLAARRALDIAPIYDVVDALGVPIGNFRKDVTASFARTSFHFEGRGFRAYGQERSRAVAFLRRLSANSKSGFCVDFTDAQTGQLVMSSERKASIRDRYKVDVLDARIDFRLAAAMTVGIDLDMQS